MSTSEFEFDKKYIVDRYKQYVDQIRSRDDGYDPKNAKQVGYSSFQVLEKIKQLYYFVLENQKLKMRRTFIHDDDKFLDLYNIVKTHIKNKIRSTSGGKIYLNVSGYKTFVGDQEEYEEYVLENKSKMSSLMGKIVDELNSVINGTIKKDQNKPVLFDNSFDKDVSTSGTTDFQESKKPEQPVVVKLEESDYIKDIRKTFMFFTNENGEVT